MDDHILAVRRTHRNGTLAAHRRAVERAIVSMHYSPSTRPSLEQLATTAKVSRFHFARVFKSITGISPSEFNVAIRLQHAKKLLLMASRPVTEVAFEAGYESPSAFSTQFTERVGISPSLFRRLGQLIAGIPVEELCAAMHSGATPTAATAARSNRFVITDCPEEVLLIVAGVFCAAAPFRVPIACTSIPRGSELCLPEISQGQYVCAVGIPRGCSGADLLLQHDRMVIGTSTAGLRSDVIRFRRRQLTDPPLTLAFPLLVLGSRD